jgi:hypothetical protein
MGIAARPHRRATSIAVGIALVIGLAAPPVLAVEPVATTIDMAWQGTPEGGVPFTATVTLSLVEPQGAPATDATGDVTVAEGTTVLGSCPLDTGTCNMPPLTLATGDHTLTVSYAGDEGFAGATTDKLVPVVANKIDATGVGLNRTTFYPYRDGYKDKVTARGTRNEPASVTIKVKSPTGKTLKTVTIATGTGAYAWAWNGRNASGKMYAAGKYKITQTLNDGHMSKTWKSYVNLSAKRLYTYTKSYKKSMAQRSAGSPSKGWVGWKFTLPSATVYKKVVFSVYGKSGSPRGVFGPHDYSICPSNTTWNYRCTSPYATFPASWSWKSVSGSVSRNRHGTTVRLYAIAGYRTYLQYGRVTVTYAVLK